MFISFGVTNMITNKGFVLASKSKSRHKILKQNKLKFTTTTPNCNEEKTKKELIKNKKKPTKIALALAKEKAKSRSLSFPNKLVVGCDTIIVYKNSILSKAKNMKEAEKKIKLISGDKHTIISALCVYTNNKRVWQTHQETKVTIRKLNTKQIKKYLNKCGKKILHSVGCYQIETNGPTIIENIDGDYFNVMGIPLFPFLKFLEKTK